jgi:hypothetical protein
MKQRGVSERDVFRTLSRPDVRGLPTQPKRQRVRWNQSASMAIDVVYQERKDVIVIVTVIRIRRAAGRRRPKRRGRGGEAMNKMHYRVHIETESATGDVLAVYFQIRRGKSHECREFQDGAVFADYNKKGELLGVEMLAPCSVSIVDTIASNEPAALRQHAKRFLRNSGPRQLIMA